MLLTFPLPSLYGTLNPLALRSARSHGFSTCQFVLDSSAVASVFFEAYTCDPSDGALQRRKLKCRKCPTVTALVNLAGSYKLPLILSKHSEASAVCVEHRRRRRKKYVRYIAMVCLNGHHASGQCTGHNKG